MLYASQDWKAVDDALSQDITTLCGYLQTLRLKLSKTVTAASHLNNREAKRKLDVYNSGNLLPPCSVPTCLGVKLNRSRCRGDLRDGVQVPRHCTFPLFALSTAHQFGVVVRILISLTAFLIMLCALSLDACVPHQRRTCLSSEASSQLNSAD